MQSLKDLKRSGRGLRAHLAKTFQRDVSLSEAYEALAAMADVKDWNTLSALAKATPVALPQEGPAHDNILATLRDAIVDTSLFQSKHQELLSQICATIWKICVEGWRARSSSGNCEFLIESTDICEGLNAFGIIATGAEGYSATVEEQMDQTLLSLGYYTKAAQLAEGTLSLTSPLIFAQDTINICPNEVFKNSSELLALRDINMLGLVPEYDVPDTVAEWRWIELHHSFAHRGNGVEGGVWEFMVRSDKFTDPLDIPVVLRPAFESAQKAGISWLMFHQ
ncbi:MAG: glyoxalase superfamily protein [Agitococcus sp.]|nr:glyoxalase superfamily protein [Agitococcus sp.]MDO9179190.1 glyoxalase superfamily protein [Agitococcus sp.]